ncbi:hypothetical protein [Micromonospora sp. NPDC048898]|uniref:hypothetical protein n=1 Tax=Micromonospora sp. NPDC048898 TaxID=3364260 RepID=UPI00371C1207
MPESTRRAYSGDLRRFLTWCSDQQLLDVIPALDEVAALAAALHTLLASGPDIHLVVSEYVNTVVDSGPAPATIERALAAIAAARRAAGVGVLPTHGPRAVLRDYGSDRASSGAGIGRWQRVPVVQCDGGGVRSEIQPVNAWHGARSLSVRERVHGAAGPPHAQAGGSVLFGRLYRLLGGALSGLWYGHR